MKRKDKIKEKLGILVTVFNAIWMYKLSIHLNIPLDRWQYFILVGMMWLVFTLWSVSEFNNLVDYFDTPEEEED